MNRQSFNNGFYSTDMKTDQAYFKLEMTLFVYETRYENISLRSLLICPKDLLELISVLHIFFKYFGCLLCFSPGKISPQRFFFLSFLTTLSP